MLHHCISRLYPELKTFHKKVRRLNTNGLLYYCIFNQLISI